MWGVGGERVFFFGVCVGERVGGERTRGDRGHWGSVHGHCVVGMHHPCMLQMQSPYA